MYAQKSRVEDYTPLQKAIQAKDIALVKALIKEGVDINEESRYGTEAIELAIRTDQIEIVKLLLSKGATSKWGLQYAVGNNNAEMVRLLINNNFEFGYAMVYAAENNNLSMVHMLVRNDAEVRVSQKRKRGLFRKYYVSPIEMAVKNGNKAMSLFLIEHGAPLSEAIDECFDYKQNTVLKALIDDNSNSLGQFLEPAFRKGNEEIIDYLIVKGADIHHRDTDGNTLLHLSALNGHASIVKRCVELHELDIQSKNNLGETPLMLSVQGNNISLVTYLLDKGANVDHENNKGETALFYTTENNLSMFNLLVSKGADVSHKTIDNTTLLINAAENKNYTVVKTLLENDADIHVKNNSGHTAFQYIISPHDRNSALVQLFLSKGADIDVRDVTSGKSMMHYAIEREKLEDIKTLVNLGASINVKDTDGNRPRVDEPEIIKYLVENGADINAVDSRHDSYLCVAVHNNDLELAHYLVSKGIDVNQNCYFSEPPIIKAVESNNLTLVEFLADNGADVNAIGYFNRNVMEYAEREGNHEIIEFLKENGAMTKSEKRDLYKKSIDMEHDIRRAVNDKDEQQLAYLLKNSKGLVIQNRVIEKAAVFAAEEGNPLLVELLIDKLRFDINEQVNASNQNLLMIATINDETSLVSYLINKGCNLQMFDAHGRKAHDYAKSKAMRRIYKDIK